MQTPIRHILILLCILYFSSCQEDKYADWKIINKAWLENFKEENKNNPDFIVTESGLCYRIIHEGYYAQPTINSKIKASYTGKLVTGKTFDKRTEPVLLSSTVPGWQEAIPKIKRGGRILLYIPSELGYGDKGSGNIPPYSTLIFDVEIIDVINYY